jgi:hypothetical protein
LATGAGTRAPRNVDDGWAWPAPGALRTQGKYAEAEDRAHPKLSTRLDSLASWQIVRVQCSGFRVSWNLNFQDESCSPKVVDSPRLACLLANRASSVFRVQGGLDFNFSRWIVLTQSCRLASTRLLWQIVRVQCSGFRVGWILIFQESWIVLGQSCRLASTRLPLGKSCEFSVQGSGWIGF